MVVTKAVTRGWASRKEPMEIPKWLAGVVASILVALVIGAGGQGVMLYSASQVTNERLAVMGETIKEVKADLSKIREASTDRWTRSSHDSFAANMRRDLESLRISSSKNAANIEALIRAVRPQKPR